VEKPSLWQKQITNLVQVLLDWTLYSSNSLCHYIEPFSLSPLQFNSPVHHCTAYAAVNRRFLCVLGTNIERYFYNLQTHQLNIMHHKAQYVGENYEYHSIFSKSLFSNEAINHISFVSNLFSIVKPFL